MKPLSPARSLTDGFAFTYPNAKKAETANCLRRKIILNSTGTYFELLKYTTYFKNKKYMLQYTR